jgi:hypothetical protein
LSRIKSLNDGRFLESVCSEPPGGIGNHRVVVYADVTKSAQAETGDSV